MLTVPWLTEATDSTLSLTHSDTGERIWLAAPIQKSCKAFRILDLLIKWEAAKYSGVLYNKKRFQKEMNSSYCGTTEIFLQKSFSSTTFSLFLHANTFEKYSMKPSHIPTVFINVNDMKWKFQKKKWKNSIEKRENLIIRIFSGFVCNIKRIWKFKLRKRKKSEVEKLPKRRLIEFPRHDTWDDTNPICK